MPAIRRIAPFAILLILPALVAAQDPAPEATPAASPPAPAPTLDSGKLADNVMLDTIIKLRNRTRIAARVEQTVDMLNQKFELKGSYYKESGNRVRLQLDLQGAGDNTSTMLQVCDGKVLWEYQKVMGMRSYRRLDVVPILKKLEEPGLDEGFRVQVLNQLGFGGPESLLVGFQGAIAFDQFADRDVNGVPSFVLGGKWKDRTGLVGQNDRALPPTAPLPPYIPSNIQVFVDKANSWPYRIEMIGAAPTAMLEDTSNIDPATGRTIGKAKPLPKIDVTNITLLYTLLPESEIKPDEQFVFAAPQNAPNLTDGTESFLADLDRVIQYKLNENKAKEAAAEAAGEPLIRPQAVPPVDLPTPQPIDAGTPAAPK